MKSLGIVRRVDRLGRIVIPKELRKTLNIAEQDSAEIFVKGNSVILRKYQPSCIFCDCADEVMEYKEQNICKRCLENIQNLL